MIRLQIQVDDITQILAAGYTVVRVYTDTAEDGNFTTLDGTVTLVAGDTGYEYVDTSGTAATWYKVAYYGSTPGESTKSDARKGSTFAAYSTVSEFKRRLDIDEDDDVDDHMLGLLLDGISRAIDEETGTRFYTTTSDETRYYTAEFTDELWTGDLLTITTLKADEDGDRTYERTWTTDDYDLMPFNASLDSRPYTKIAVTPNGDYAFPTITKGIQIVGTFGYSTSTPARIREATLLAGERLFRRKDAIFGIVGTASLGEMRQIAGDMLRKDTEIRALLHGFDRSMGPLAV